MEVDLKDGKHYRVDGLKTTSWAADVRKIAKRSYGGVWGNSG